MENISFSQRISERFWSNNVPVKVMTVSTVGAIAMAFFSGNFYMGIYIGVTIAGFMKIVQSSYLEELKAKSLTRAHLLNSSYSN